MPMVIVAIPPGSPCSGVPWRLACPAAYAALVRG